MTDRRPVCGSCERGIRPCAPCCRHSGWVHRHSGKHECDESKAVAFAKLYWPPWKAATARAE
jgi:hypothetical protein